MKKLFVLLLLLSGCASLQPAVVKVEVPVPVPCVIAQIAVPGFAVDELAISGDIYEQMLSLRAERIQRQAYEHTLEQALKSCQ